MDVATIVLVGLLVALIAAVSWKINGETGPQGPMGIQGRRGVQGPLAGGIVVGFQGPTGPTGTAGLGLPGPRGPSGPVASYAGANLTLVPNGVSAEAQSIENVFTNQWTLQLDVPETSPVIISNCTVSTSGAVAAVSATGPLGATVLDFVFPVGPSGAQGFQGATNVPLPGPTGPSGPSGPTPGPTGPTGAVGIEGFQGPSPRPLVWVIYTSRVLQPLSTSGTATLEWDPALSVVPSGQADQLAVGDTQWVAPYTGLYRTTLMAQTLMFYNALTNDPNVGNSLTILNPGGTVVMNTQNGSVATPLFWQSVVLMNAGDYLSVYVTNPAPLVTELTTYVLNGSQWTIEFLGPVLQA